MLPRPAYVPILLPGEAEAFRSAPAHWEAVLIAAPHALQPRPHDLLAAARDCAHRVWVDPCTAHFQFEGHLASEPMRALPYAPGRGTPAHLWQPRDFFAPQRRRDLVEAVFALQRRLGCRQLLAPYFLVADVSHPWHALAVETLGEALAAADEPVIGVVCVDIDGLLGPGRVARFAAPFAELAPAGWLVMVVNYDERVAPPEEVHAVLDLVRRLGESAPVVPAYLGRTGLLAVAVGARGYAGGSLELESLPRRLLREGLVNLHANAYYLAGGLSRLPVADAQRVAGVVRELRGARGGARPIGRQVSRERVVAALADKRTEVERLAAAADPLVEFRRQLDEALARWRRAARLLAESGARQNLSLGTWHYLEVLREVAGGPPATPLRDPGF